MLPSLLSNLLALVQCSTAPWLVALGTEHVCHSIALQADDSNSSSLTQGKMFVSCSEVEQVQRRLCAGEFEQGSML